MTGDEEFLFVDEIARICRVPKSSVRYWLNTGKLSSLRPGRRRLVRRADFERFLSERTSARGDRSSTVAEGEKR